MVTNHESLRDANSKQLGNHADVWTVVIDGTPVRIAVSQPYPEWHDMRLCYSGNGWQVNDWKPTLEPIDVGDKAKQEEVSDRETRQIDRWVVSYAEMVRDTGEFGTLLFCGLSSGGDLLSPPMVGIYSMFDDRIKDRSTLRSNIIMLQLWAETEKPLIPEQMRKLRSLFNSFRIRVLNELSYASESLTPEQRLNVTIVTKGGINR